MNPWVYFVKQNTAYPHQKNKNFIKDLSHQWKNHKSQLVTLHIDYVNKLFTEKQNLQFQLQQLQQHVTQLQQQLDYYYFVCSDNETFQDTC